MYVCMYVTPQSFDRFDQSFGWFQCPLLLVFGLRESRTCGQYSFPKFSRLAPNEVVISREILSVLLTIQKNFLTNARCGLIYQILVYLITGLF